MNIRFATGSRIRAVRAALLGSLALLPAGTAVAQEQVPEAPPTTQVEDIVVTAQKRSENLQDVPIAINAVTASAALSSGVKSTDDLIGAAPAVNITRVTQSPLVFIRGVGTENSNVGEEGSNPIYVDGFYNPSLSGSVFSFNNIERIEVLKGPQGTLFGRNATGGAINVITRDPSTTPSFSGSIGYGNYRTVETSAYVTGGLATNLAADLAVYYRDQGNGWGKNLTTGLDVYKSNEVALRSKLQYRDEATEITLGADYSRNDSDYGIAWQTKPGSFTPVLFETYTGKRHDIHLNVQPRGLVEQWGVNLRASHDTSFAQLVSMTSYRNIDADYDFDQDASSLPLVDAYFLTNTKSFTQEVQVQSLPSSNIKWILGVFYFKSTASLEPLTLSGLAFQGQGFLSDTRFGEIKTDSLAGYAQATVPLGEATEITAGVRYTRDKKDFDARRVLTPLAGAPIVIPKIDSKTWEKLTWRGAVSHRFSDEFNVFASISRGYKSGQFAILNPSNAPIDPETLTAYEAGFKSDLFDRRVRLNASYFHYDYKNIQLQQIIAGQQFLLNAAAAKVDGIDADLVVKPFANFSLTASGSYLFRHEYVDFENAPGQIVNPIPPNCTNPAQCGGNRSILIDASGNDMVRSPKFTASLTAAYEIPTDIGNFAISGTLIHNSGFAWEASNRVRQPSYDLVNGQISWQMPDENLRIRLWAKNLFDKSYAVHFSSSITDSQSYGAPRTYGFALDLNF